MRLVKITRSIKNHQVQTIRIIIIILRPLCGRLLLRRLLVCRVLKSRPQRLVPRTTTTSSLLSSSTSPSSSSTLPLVIVSVVIVGDIVIVAGREICFWHLHRGGGGQGAACGRGKARACNDGLRLKKKENKKDLWAQQCLHFLVLDNIQQCTRLVVNYNVSQKSIIT